MDRADHIPAPEASASAAALPRNPVIVQREAHELFQRWMARYLEHAKSAPVQPRRAGDQPEVELLATLFLALIAHADGSISSFEGDVVTRILKNSPSLTPKHYLSVLEANRAGGTLKERLRELVATASSLDAAGRMQGLPTCVEVFERIGQVMVDCDRAGRQARALELGRLVEWMRAVAGRPQSPLRNLPGPRFTNPGQVPVPFPALPTPAAGKAASVEASLRDIDALVGLASVKKETLSLVNLARITGMRRDRGLPGMSVSRHLVFTGNPGTGKTTVARLLSRIYGDLGLLSKGHLVEVDRASLVGGFLGQTALKTQEVIERAKGGILFVDEAYTLSDGGPHDSFGQEALDTLMKAMEDLRDDLIVIVAGYSDKMETFLDSNPGLRSRMPKTIEFPDYGDAEMTSIFGSFGRAARFRFTRASGEGVTEGMRRLCEGKGRHFGNGRLARNLFEAVVGHQADRLAGLGEIPEDALTLIGREDVVSAFAGFGVSLGAA